ncbi:SBBP repeat-containing protein [Mycolicibacter sinensis]|uniref:SBBP repeat-containing protein n=1 Tax=Mycolicibacter sinensis (strain JDM601) TaxID=875328 RepID=UPI003D1623BF
MKLPFIGLKAPTGITVDYAGNIYVTGYGAAQVLKLPAGSHTPVALPFTGFTGPHPPNGVAVDSAGDVYVVDGLHQRVVELPAKSTRQVERVFGTAAGNSRGGVAVDTAGNVYVADHYRVLKLPAR